MKCLILAGGFATRLWPLTKDKPKPLLRIKGKPIITHIVNKVPAKFEIVVSTNKRFEKDFIDWKESLDKNIELFIENSRKDKEKLGAVGALNYFIKKEKLKEDLLVIAGDNYFEFSLKEFLSYYRNKPLIAIHDVHDKDKAKRYGVVKVSNNKIIGFEEKPERPETSLISTAIYLLPVKCFSHLDDFCSIRRDNLGEFIKYLMKKEDIMASEFDGLWFDIGNFESYLKAHIKITKTVIKEEGSRINNSFLQGSVYIGRNTRISGSLVKDSIIMDDSLVENSTIKDSIIDAKTIIKDSRVSFNYINMKSVVVNDDDQYRE